jgi:hypothetical protein
VQTSTQWVNWVQVCEQMPLLQSASVLQAVPTAPLTAQLP